MAPSCSTSSIRLLAQRGFGARPAKGIQQIEIDVYLRRKVPVERRTRCALVSWWGHIQRLVQDLLNDCLALATLVAIGCRRLDPVQESDEEAQLLDET